MSKIKLLWQNEFLFIISLVLAVFTSFLSFPDWSYLDWKVLLTLFNLMAVVAALKKLRILDRIAVSILSRYGEQRKISMLLILISFISSMLITNDVALITLVPISLIVARRAGFDPCLTIILQTLAANIGSSLTPVGNPQNLFLFSFYHTEVKSFLLVMLPFVFLGGLWLLVLNLKVNSVSLDFELDKIRTSNTKETAVMIVLFIMVLLGVFRYIDYRYVFLLTLLVLVILDHSLFKEIDYYLLGTFACFFIFVGNIAHIEYLHTYLRQCFNSPGRAYFYSMLISQLLSNVPCAILAANFTDQWRAVLLGVNIGGMGTLIASLANLISYKLYIKEYDGKAYLRSFLVYNGISLLVFSVLIYYLVL